MVFIPDPRAGRAQAILRNRPKAQWTVDKLEQTLAERLALASSSLTRAFQKVAVLNVEDTTPAGSVAQRDGGFLSRADVRALMRKLNLRGVPTAVFEGLWRKMDIDDSGAIAFDEFRARFGGAIAGGSDTRAGVSDAATSFGDFGDAKGDRLAAAARASAAAQEARVVSWDAARVKATLGERFETNQRSMLRSFKKYDRDRSGRRVGVGMSTAWQRARTRSHRVGFSY